MERHPAAIRPACLLLHPRRPQARCGLRLALCGVDGGGIGFRPVLLVQRGELLGLGDVDRVADVLVVRVHVGRDELQDPQGDRQGSGDQQRGLRIDAGAREGRGLLRCIFLAKACNRIDQRLDAG